MLREHIKVINVNILEAKKFAFIILIILLTDIAILLDIPVLRVVFGFLCFILLPGALILFILKLNKIGITEKIVLSVGLSVSFLMFFGLLIDKLYFGLGYATPLSTISLVVSFSAAMIILCVIGYKTKTFEKSFIKNWLPDFNLNTAEKAFLIVPITFPALSIFGMHVMNTTGNNIILMFLLFLIPIYVPFVCFFNHKFPKRLYPVVIFLISISILLLYSLRSNHLIGTDTHVEYYFFQTTLDNLHWSIIGYTTLDACLTISLLPTIYQSILNIPSEFLYKILHSLLLSISPLVIYVISKKYIGELYGFLASCFFMFQGSFLGTAPNAWRSHTAVLFFALAMMVLFSDKIDPLKKRILFIVFMASCMVSHYSTTYIFFFIMLGAFVGIEILSKKFTFKKVMSLTLVILFFSLIFFWYSQVTEAAFNAGISFVENTFLNLNKFFIEESRTEAVRSLTGQELTYPILSHAYFVLTWCTFILIGIGVLTMIVRHKEMIDISNVKHKKPDFLKTKFEMEYLTIAVGCAGLLVIILALPYISTGYDLFRTYSLARVILSVCFVIGGIVIAKTLSSKLLRNVLSKTLRGKKALPKKQKKGKNTLQNPVRKSIGGENGSQVRAYLIILLILIPYSMFTSGLMYQLFGVGSSIILNSEGERYDTAYVHDQESYGAKWLSHNRQQNLQIHADPGGYLRLTSQGGFSKSLINSYSVFTRKEALRKGYIYLRYYNIVADEFLEAYGDAHNMTKYSDIFIRKSKIYDNGGSQVWR